MKKYIVRLNEEERAQLNGLVSKGKTAAYKIRHAHILLKADASGPNWPDEKIAETLGCHVKSIPAIRERFVMQGLDAAVGRKPLKNPPRERILDGQKEAHLIALSCGKPPEGFGRWSLRLLADKLVALEIVEEISHETVRQTLKKTSLSRI